MRIKIRCLTSDDKFVGMCLFPISALDKDILQELPEDVAIKYLNEKYTSAFVAQCRKLSMSEVIHVNTEIIPNYVSKD